LQQEIALQEGEALVLMGHGTLHPANAIYLDMNAACQKAERQRVFVGTVEAKLDIGDVLRLVQQNGYRQAALAPMMLVAGDHAIHDMAGDEPDSWKNQFLSAGITPRCVMRGIGEYKAVRALYLRKLEALLG
jgi:sirohydrochlorin cobaltochelatase